MVGGFESARVARSLPVSPVATPHHVAFTVALQYVAVHVAIRNMRVRAQRVLLLPARGMLQLCGAQLARGRVQAARSPYLPSFPRPAWRQTAPVARSPCRCRPPDVTAAIRENGYEMGEAMCRMRGMCGMQFCAPCVCVYEI